MTLVHRFTIGGETDISLGIELRPEYKEPILPRTRDRSVRIPGREGRWEFDGDLAERDIVLECVIVNAATQEELQEKARALAAVLLDQHGRPKDVTLVFTKEPLKTYTVRYSGKTPLRRLVGGTKGYFALPLIAADPFAYGADVVTEETITTDGQEVTVANAGDYTTPPVFWFTNAGGSNLDGFTLTLTKLKT